MANSSEVQYLRLLLAEPNQPTGVPPAPGDSVVGSLFSDDQLDMLIEKTSMTNRAAEIAWKAKAAFLQTLVDVDESGSSRKLSQMFKQAVAMAEQFKLAADEEWAAIQGAYRTGPVAGSPWGAQFVNQVAPFGSYIIGDVSRAGFGGTIFFIEVPVDPDILDEHNLAQPAQPVLAVNEVTEVQVPTNRRVGMYVEKGRTFNFALDYLDPNTGETVDITGWTAQITVRTAPGGTLLWTQALVTDVPGGKFTLNITPTNTSGFTFTQGDYEVVVADTSGNSISLVHGTMFVSTGDA